MKNILCGQTTLIKVFRHNISQLNLDCKSDPAAAYNGAERKEYMIKDEYSRG